MGAQRASHVKMPQTVLFAFKEGMAMEKHNCTARNWALSWALVCLAGGAMAQWQWIDANGQKIFSDKAPPPSIPESQILRDSSGRPYVPVGKAKTVQDEKAPTYGFKEFDPNAAVSPTPKATPKGQKQASKSAQELEQEKKAEEERLAKEAEAKRKEQERKEANCKTIRGNMAALDSGRRLATYNEKGERSIMGDAERAAERKSLEDALKQNECQ